MTKEEVSELLEVLKAGKVARFKGLGVELEFAPNAFIEDPGPGYERPNPNDDADPGPGDRELLWSVGG